MAELDRADRVTYKRKYENSWAIVVGINAYQKVRSLQYACNDANLFADQLIERFEFPSSNVVRLLDKDATLSSILFQMHKLARTTGENDRVIVFYAGHGHTLPAYGGNAGFLVPVDGGEDDTSNLLSWEQLVSTSRMIQAKHMLFIMDACYGGGIAKRKLSPGSRRLVQDMLGRYSRQYLTAGKADQEVADGGGPRTGHSLFTGHLLDALDGGLQTSDGYISANMLMAHVYDRVANDARSQQSPHYGFLEGDGDFFFTNPVIETSANEQTDAGDVFSQVPADLTAPE